MTIAESITQALYNHAQHSPSRTFAVFTGRHGSEDITYGQLLERSLSLAAHLPSVEATDDRIVAIMLGQTPRALYWFLGAMLAGAVPTLMPPPNPKQRTDIFVADHQQLFRRLKPAAMIAPGSIARLFSNLEVIDDDELLVVERPFDSPARRNDDPDRVAAMQHSSGTTGLKKGVMLTHRAIVSQVDAYAEALGFTSADTIASWLPLYHDMGLIACFLMPLLVGAKVVVLDPFEWVARPETLFDAIKAHQAKFCWLPNFAFSHLANLSRSEANIDLSTVRAFVNCSEPCTMRTFERFLDRFQKHGARAESLQVCYALAENVFAATQTALGQPPKSLERDGKRILSCGRPIAGVHIEIIDRGGDTAREGAIGEITIRSPFLFSGYFGEKTKTAEKLRDGCYRTGDLGFITDGELYVTGRIDDMLILSGRNIYAHEIEAIINDIAGIVPGRCVAFTVEDPRTETGGLVVLAECIPGANGTEVGRAVRTAVSDHLGFSIYAFEVVPRGSLVKSTSGKISRSRNRDIYLAGTRLERST